MKGIALKVYPGDVTFDGKCDLNDITLMTDYFWRGGAACSFTKEYPVPEFMDADNDGEINPLDVRRVMQLAGY